MFQEFHSDVSHGECINKGAQLCSNKTLLTRQASVQIRPALEIKECLGMLGLGGISHLKITLLDILFMGKPPRVSKHQHFIRKSGPSSPASDELLAFLVLGLAASAVSFQQSFGSKLMTSFWPTSGPSPRPPSLSLSLSPTPLNGQPV